MATLKKMTRMGADVRQIARLLQAKAPEGHMLAYITPEEAQILKNQGGSGKPHADTGVPSFEVGSTGMGDDYSYTGEPAPVEPVSVPSMSPVSSVEAPTFSAAQPAASVDYSQFAPQPSAAPAPATSVEPGFSVDRSAIYGPAGYGAPVSPTELAAFDKTQPTETGQTFSQKAEDVTKFLDKNASLVKLLGLGATGLGGLYRGRQGAKQAEALRGELGTLGQDYRRQGQELLTKAQTGELTAPQQQQLQAAQAQLAQQATARGGVGSMQAATQIEALRQQYVAQNMDRALQLLGIADQYQANAIKAGYSASKDAQAAADKFYGAMGQFLVPQSQQTIPRA